jgi:large subunit ribosomal protein L19
MKAQNLTRETIRHIGEKEVKLPPFAVGDTVAISLKIKEGDKERIQVFEGDIIARHKKGASSSFLVRKISNGVAVERIFPENSPTIQDMKIIRHGVTRRAKLYYLRDREGKASRLKERRIQQEVVTKAEVSAVAQATQE